MALPWFEYYDETATAVTGAPPLTGLKSVKTLGDEKNDKPLPEITPVDPTNVKLLRKHFEPDQVREGSF